MSDEVEAAVAERSHALHVRVRSGLRKPHNWVQLIKFCAVGGSGYVVNLCVFALCVEVIGLHHLVGATAAFVVAVMNNFWWNRHWTFRAGQGHAGFQAARFFTVSVAAFLVQVTLLAVLVAATAAFAVAVTNNFWWNRHWTFRARGGHAGFQAARFFTVSVGAFLFAAAVLELLVSSAGVAELPAQAIAIVAATPLNFVGNKMWSFARSPQRA